MQIEIRKSFYKNIQCVLFESENLTIVVIPEQGGKIQSIRNKKTNMEYLYQSPWKKYNEATYDSSYLKGEFSGFDEMFPTITECYYPLFPWKGIMIPDHGEVWSQPWEYELQSCSIVLRIHGVRFPYTLEKKIEFVKEQIIKISYKVTNHSNYDFNYIWAAHPLFNCTETTRLILPGSIDRVINTVPGERLGGFGNIHSWPITSSEDKRVIDLSKIGPEEWGCYEKYYAVGKVLDGWCGFHDEMTGEFIGLSYPADKVPYLGVWVNQGGYANQYNAALEPCTGALDCIDTAIQWNQSSVLKARETSEWFLNLTFENVKQVIGIDSAGNVIV